MIRSHNKTYLILGFTFFFLASIFRAADLRLQNEAAAAQLAPHVLRFHILANSDTRADQDVKLEIRSLILDYMNKFLQKDAGKEETARWMEEHKQELEILANTRLERQGFDYRSRLELTNCYFPTRYYDGILFPSGNYDAVRITLGKGEGHNWWCVLYPKFCLMEDVKKQKQDDVSVSKEHHPVMKIRFKLGELFHLYPSENCRTTH